MSKRISLERLITQSVLSVGLLLGAFGLAYAYWYAKESLHQTVGLTFQELARQSAQNIGLLLTKEIERVEEVSELPLVRRAVRQGARVSLDDPELKRFREAQHRNFSSVVLVAQDGRAVGGITSEATRTHYHQQPWWSSVFHEGRSWAGLLSHDQTGRWYWEVVVPIHGPSGQVVGALKVVIGKSDLLAPILSGRIGQTGHAMLLDESGRVVACALLDPARHVRLEEPVESRLLGGSWRLPEAMWTEVREDTHSDRHGIVGLAPVRLRPDIALSGRWTVVVQQSPGEIYSPLVTLTKRLALIGLAAVILIAWFRWRLARRIAVPLNTLVRQIRAWGQPHQTWATGGPKKVGIEEIDTLAASFEDLAVRLDHASQEQERYVRALEEANSEIARSEEHYRMLWNHSLELRLLVGPDGIVRDLNRRGEIKLWRPAHQVVGTSVFTLFEERDRPSLERLLAEVVANGKERTAGEWSVPAPAGDCFVMEVDLVPIEGRQGPVEAVMLQLTDLTEKKQLQDQLLRSEHLASLSQFASMFAHDIRNPLAGIKKTLELMAQRPELQAAPIRRWCEDLQFTIELLQGMINDMLDVYQEHYSGLPLITSVVSLNDVIHEVVHQFRLEAEAQASTFQLNVPHEAVMVAVDRRRIERVLINVVHNALKYSPTGGIVTVSVWLQGRHAGAIRPLSDSDRSETVCLSVEDEGPGIDPLELPHIFEMFFRHRDRQDGRIGRGLGLHFCRLVVEGHHGVIRAANRPQGGACFTIELPVRDVNHVGHLAHC